MKILHTADWHLASPINCRLSPEKAQERRKELLSRFSDMVRYAEENDVSAILLCGDTGDSGVLPFSIQDYLCDVMRNAPSIRFFFVSGNHDRIRADAVGGIFTKSRLLATDGLPENVTVFGDQWESVMLSDRVTVSGCAISDNGVLAPPPVFREDFYNIVMLHGTFVTQSGGDSVQAGVKAAMGTNGDQETIYQYSIADHNVDYLALGHYHSFRHGKIDRRGTWCYAGCPEGRGFDECGEKGFVLLKLDGTSCQGAEFHPFAKRKLCRVPVDVSALPSGIHALESAVFEALREVPSGDLVRVVLSGEDDADAVRDLSYLEKRLSERFYYAEVKDERSIRIDPEQYRYDISLRGEFVRRVMDSDLNESEKADVLRMGLSALKGE